MTPIQFGYITIDGTKYPVKFGTAQSRDYCKMLECEIKDYNELFKSVPVVDAKGKPVLDAKGSPVMTNKFTRMETDGEEMIVLVYTALKQGARVEKQDFTLTQDDVADLIDYMNFNQSLWSEFFAIMVDGLDTKEGEQASPNGKNQGMKAA